METTIGGGIFRPPRTDRPKGFQLGRFGEMACWGWSREEGGRARERRVPLRVLGEEGQSRRRGGERAEEGAEKGDGAYWERKGVSSRGVPSGIL